MAVRSRCRATERLLLGALVGEVWYATTVVVWCGEGAAAELTVSPVELRTAILSDPEGFIALVREVAPERLGECEAALAIASHTHTGPTVLDEVAGR